MDVKLFRPLPNQGLECLLCPHHCKLKPGLRGLCRVRVADNDSIHSSPTPVTVIAEDPVEKKPFYHFKPGTSTLSIGFSGCNLKCPFCQNHSLVESETSNKSWTSDFIVQTAIERDSSSVCFTYSEPTMHFEFLIECSAKLKKAGIPALLVTNGCINPKPAEALLENITAVKVDLKSFNSEWYRNELKGDLTTVCSFIRTAHKYCHLEVVSLIIPGKNDSLDEIAQSSRFISSISRDIPFHLTAYFPQYKYNIPPTPSAVLNKLRQKASEHLNYVYTGNTGIIENTYCPDCDALLINRRQGMTVGIHGNMCKNCGKEIYGVF